ncbi:hypothetical protein TorRG33x02_126230 [Trema orientale]|uniref:Transmembrane protein n=1 Tax=Trema orientale TaxID=63057 RepID=A0A2P5F1B5_TREOI|nr:hypothetical protein TorRG33x02_126230 [Trema orientale]
MERQNREWEVFFVSLICSMGHRVSVVSLTIFTPLTLAPRLTTRYKISRVALVVVAWLPVGFVIVGALILGILVRSVVVVVTGVSLGRRRPFLVAVAGVVYLLNLFSFSIARVLQSKYCVLIIQSLKTPLIGEKLRKFGTKLGIREMR